MTRHATMKASLADAESLGIPASVFRRRWLTLSTLCASLLAVAMGNASLNLSLAAIATELQLTGLQLTWVVEIYSLLFAALLFTFSAVGDRYGRKVVMQAGLVLFIAASLYAALLAKTGTGLIASRAVMGIGGAMVMPTTLSVINVIFPPQERARAVSIWAAVAAVGMLIGVVIGGLLLDHLGWESTFWIGAVIAAASLVGNQFLAPESRDDRKRPIDWLGGLLSTVGLLGLVYAIMEAPSRGFDDKWVLLGLIAGCACLAAFVVWQRRTSHPMLDVHLFGQRAFSVSALVMIIAIFSLMGVFFGASQLFILVMGYGAFKTSLAILPPMVPMIILSPIAPLLASKIGTRWTVSSGLCLVIGSFVLMTRWPTAPTYIDIALGMSVMTSGMALASTPATSMMMSAVPRARSGMGSAMNDTTRELGSALGIAVLGAFLSSGYTNKIAPVISALPEQARVVAEKSLAGALAVSAQLGDAGSALADASKAAWMDSLKASMVVGAIICAFALIIAAVWMPHREKWVTPDSLEPIDGPPRSDC
jgi:EmrB/QacA subfamily drug resistance transporter